MQAILVEWHQHFHGYAENEFENIWTGGNKLKSHLLYIHTLTFFEEESGLIFLLLLVYPHYTPCIPLVFLKMTNTLIQLTFKIFN